MPEIPRSERKTQNRIIALLTELPVIICRVRLSERS